MQLLNFYQSRFGNAVKHQGNGWNGPCPLCGGEPGRSDRFMVWPERDEKLGETCAEHGIKGIWACRQCGKSGDTIAYLMQIDGLDFKAALAELGINGGRPDRRRRPAPVEPCRKIDAFTPHACPPPTPEWQAYADKLIEEATAGIEKEPQAMNWLASRGIGAEAVRQYRIGYLSPEGRKYPGRWRARSALGLPPKTGDDGKVHDKIFIPRGILIPTFDPKGRPLNLRVRRHKADLRPMSGGKAPPKYMELEGSCKAPMLLRANKPSHLAVYFVTEAELDALLIHFAGGGVVGALAVRTNRGKPDVTAHALLRSATRICVALDYDDPGAIGVPWWEQTYPQAKRWPTPEGKDPGEAFQLGVDIREWIGAALPATIQLPSSARPGRECGADSRKVSIAHAEINSDNNFGQLGTIAAGRLDIGGKGALENAAGEEKGKSRQDACQADVDAAAGEFGFTAEEVRILRSAMPREFISAPLSFFPAEVLRTYLLWQGIPASFTKRQDGNGKIVGFSWDYDYAWAAKHRERFDRFFAYQDKCDVLWDWMFSHPDEKITWQNLLAFWR